MRQHEIEEIIDNRVDYILKDYEKLTNNFHMLDETVRQGAFSSIKNTKNYDLITKPQQHLIDTFEAIGWPDPFPTQIKLDNKITEPSPTS